MARRKQRLRDGVDNNNINDIIKIYTQVHGFFRFRMMRPWYGFQLNWFLLFYFKYIHIYIYIHEYIYIYILFKIFFFFFFVFQIFLEQQIKQNKKQMDTRSTEKFAAHQGRLKRGRRMIIKSVE